MQRAPPPRRGRSAEQPHSRRRLPIAAQRLRSISAAARRFTEEAGPQRFIAPSSRSERQPLTWLPLFIIGACNVCQRRRRTMPAEHGNATEDPLVWIDCEACTPNANDWPAH
ncbi:hypothetical protein TCAP_06697 [Tolypocladium capitatum]|uniref:Uncharacterized protein n=1 Tax=Tolypocladium capitatum TaxID=45235 RepID=A0A2K3Q748_9HYPO|nr:hypothetical protein TCAP_06697 [Tolypocladium capitatum]